MSRDMCSHAIDRRSDFCVDCATPDELRAKLTERQSMFDELMEYCDDAKRVAQRFGRVSGEPLDEFIERLAAENNIPEDP